MPTSVSSDAILPATTSEELVTYQLETQVVSVFSTFKLSDKKDFRANVEAVLRLNASMGASLLLKGNTLKMTFAYYSGTVRVQTSGYVKCQGQGSFEEAECVAKLVIGTFRGAGQEETGLYDHRFVQVQATSCLPFRVHLRKLQLNYPDNVWFDYSIQKGMADIRFVDLKATMALGVSGKMNIYCSGDCITRDNNMAQLIEAVQRLCKMADSCKLSGSELAPETPADRSSGSRWPLACPEVETGGVKGVRRSLRQQALDVVNVQERKARAGKTATLSEELLSSLSEDGPTGDKQTLAFMVDFLQTNGMERGCIKSCLVEAADLKRDMEAKGEEANLWQLVMDSAHAKDYADYPPIQLRVPQIVKKAPQKKSSLDSSSTSSSPVEPIKKKKKKKKTVKDGKQSVKHPQTQVSVPEERKVLSLEEQKAVDKMKKRPFTHYDYFLRFLEPFASWTLPKGTNAPSRQHVTRRGTK